MRIIDSSRNSYKVLISEALNLQEAIWAIKDLKIETDVSKQTWNNGFLLGWDIIGIYTLIAYFRPKKYA
jgi:hypothetical protein